MAWGRKKTPPSAEKPRWNQDDYHKDFAGTLKEQIAAGVAPWQKPWTPGESRLPKNIQTDTPYRGGNSVYLSVTQTAKGYSDHRWATYKQISDMGGQVRKGEKATQVLFYKFDDEKKTAQEQPGTPTAEGQAEKEQTRPPMVRCYAVFNVEQADGLTLERKADDRTTAPEWKAHQTAERVIQESGVHVAHVRGDRAFYNIQTDKVTEGFYFRNPNNRANIYSLDDGATLLIGDVLDARDGIADGSAHCPTVRVMNNVPDQAALAQVFADPHCFSFQETIPGGFTPQFGGVVSDRSVVAGVRRLAANGLTWDASASYGAHESDFFFNNTVNASLGPDTPRNFDPGLYRQEEVNLNFDGSYAAIDIVNIAGGAEWRDERFDIGAGGRPSWEVGPYAAQGFVSGSATRRRWSRSRRISPAPPPTSTSGRDIHTGTRDDEWEGADCLAVQDGTTTRKVPRKARVVIRRHTTGRTPVPQPRR